MAEMEYGRPRLVAAVRECLDPHIRQERRQKPTVRRRVGQACEIEVAPFLPVQGMGVIHRPVKLLSCADAGHQIEVKGVDGCLTLAGVLEELPLIPRWAV